MRNRVAAIVIPCAFAFVAGCQQSERADSPKGASGARARGSDGFKDSFGVSRASLRDRGVATFMSLEPGRTLTYRDDEGGTLTIRVLPETRQVDGVTTRVIEEREEEDGRLVEVSRNYFAIDPASGDVYYFGEEVDIYKNGAIVNHEGAWLSGEKGARFGLAIPGRPAVGARYYQEVAPGVAMDRGEIVALDERVVTPAGAFEHCVHVQETTPIERGFGHKWYAPRIGLVKDDDMLLVSAADVP